MSSWSPRLSAAAAAEAEAPVRAARPRSGPTANVQAVTVDAGPTGQIAELGDDVGDDLRTRDVYLPDDRQRAGGYGLERAAPARLGGDGRASLDRRPGGRLQRMRRIRRRRGLGTARVRRREAGRRIGRVGAGAAHPGQRRRPRRSCELRGPGGDGRHARRPRLERDPRRRAVPSGLRHLLLHQRRHGLLRLLGSGRLRFGHHCDSQSGEQPRGHVRDRQQRRRLAVAGDRRRRRDLGERQPHLRHRHPGEQRAIGAGHRRPRQRDDGGSVPGGLPRHDPHRQLHRQRLLGPLFQRRQHRHVPEFWGRGRPLGVLLPRAQYGAVVGADQRHDHRQQRRLGSADADRGQRTLSVHPARGECPGRVRRSRRPGRVDPSECLRLRRAVLLRPQCLHGVRAAQHVRQEAALTSRIRRPEGKGS